MCQQVRGRLIHVVIVSCDTRIDATAKPIQVTIGGVCNADIVDAGHGNLVQGLPGALICLPRGM